MIEDKVNMNGGNVKGRLTLELIDKESGDIVETQKVENYLNENYVLYNQVLLQLIPFITDKQLLDLSTNVVTDSAFFSKLILSDFKAEQGKKYLYPTGNILGIGYNESADENITGYNIGTFNKERSYLKPNNVRYVYDFLPDEANGTITSVYHTKQSHVRPAPDILSDLETIKQFNLGPVYNQVLYNNYYYFLEGPEIGYKGSDKIIKSDLNFKKIETYTLTEKYHSFTIKDDRFYLVNSSYTPAGQLFQSIQVAFSWLPLNDPQGLPYREFYKPLEFGGYMRGNGKTDKDSYCIVYITTYNEDLVLLPILNSGVIGIYKIVDNQNMIQIVGPDESSEASYRVFPLEGIRGNLIKSYVNEGYYISTTTPTHPYETEEFSVFDLNTLTVQTIPFNAHVIGSELVLDNREAFFINSTSLRPLPNTTFGSHAVLPQPVVKTEAFSLRVTYDFIFEGVNWD